MLRTLKDHQKERTADIFFEIPDERKQRLSVKLRNSHFNYVQVKTKSLLINFHLSRSQFGISLTEAKLIEPPCAAWQTVTQEKTLNNLYFYHVCTCSRLSSGPLNVFVHFLRISEGSWQHMEFQSITGNFWIFYEGHSNISSSFWILLNIVEDFQREWSKGASTIS